MQTLTISKITACLQTLPAEKLAVIYDFVSYLSERELSGTLGDVTAASDKREFAFELAFIRDWDRPEEDAAWANL
jgi:hypothetical protein